MIIDERTYTCHPGKVKAFLEVYERLAKPIQWPLLGDPIGFFVSGCKKNGWYTPIGKIAGGN